MKLEVFQCPMCGEVKLLMTTMQPNCPNRHSMYDNGSNTMYRIGSLEVGP